MENLVQLETNKCICCERQATVSCTRIKFTKKKLIKNISFCDDCKHVIPQDNEHRVEYLKGI